MSLSPKPSSKSRGASRSRLDSDNKDKDAGSEACKAVNLREGDGDSMAASAMAASGAVSSPPVTASASHSGITQDLDLFSSILSGMGHLSAGGAHQPQAAASSSSQVSLPHVGSRKRKFLEQHGAAGSGKMNGVRPPFLRRNSEDEATVDHVGALHTPLVSQSGYADEEDRQDQAMDNPAVSIAAAAGHHHSLLHSISGGGGGGSVRSGSGGGRMGILSPGGNLISDIDDNLASNFDDSLSGLGVDINGGNYSVSEALLALPNLSISSSQIFKQEMAAMSSAAVDQQGHSASPAHTHKMLKDEPLSRPMSGEPEHRVSKNYGALDLSNEEAHLPDSSNSAQALNGAQGRRDFIGSVSRESSMGAINLDKKKVDRHEGKDSDRTDGGQVQVSRTTIPPLQSSSPQVPIAVTSSSNAVSSRMAKEKASASNANGGNGSSSRIEKFERLNEAVACSDKFQYILAASTSLATKISEPTITYLNQGQAYELRLKKLGDLSAYRKRQLRSVIRICFHERRLQYMEAEQISEWRNAHAGERILDLDLPLSYGIAPEEPRPSSPINVISFRWDPTRETGVFVKVNCISTEFTLKKHGGEKGVPFRLQLETYDGDIRLHAASCILQVFKLKGADRKHKQDKEKVSKRPPAEQEKFAPSYDCTVLTDLSVDSIYVPPVESPTRPPRDLGKVDPPVLIKRNNSRPNSPPKVIQEGLAAPSSSLLQESSDVSVIQRRKSQSLPVSKTDHAVVGNDLSGQPIAASASADVVSAWLSSNRYAVNICRELRSFSARDLLRLTRDELIHICGTASGIRLYNDLHLAVVVPKTTLYVAAHGSHEYSALFLEERTVDELVRCLSEAVGVSPALFSRVFMVGPMPNMLIRVTDAVVQYTKPDSAFHFSLRQQPQQQGVVVNDVILESVFMSSVHSSQESLHRADRLGGVASTRNSIEENLNVVSGAAPGAAGDAGHLVDPLASEPAEHEQLRRHRS